MYYVIQADNIECFISEGGAKIIIARFYPTENNCNQVIART